MTPTAGGVTEPSPNLVRYEGYKRYLRQAAAWISRHQDDVRLARETAARPGGGLDALDGRSDPRALHQGEAASQRRLLVTLQRLAGGEDGVTIVGSGVYGTAYAVRLTDAVRAALGSFGAFAAANRVQNVVPARGSAGPPAASARRIVVKIARLTDRGAAAALRELRTHAYLADPSVDTPPDMPNSARFVPRYFGGGLLRDATVSFMELVSGRELARTDAVDAATAAKIERAYVSLWARGIFHADAHAGNVILERGGEPKIIDFGFAVPLPRELIPKTYAQAISARWAYRVGNYAQAMYLEYEFHNPDTRALRYLRLRKLRGRTSSLRRHRASLIRGRGRSPPKHATIARARAQAQARAPGSQARAQARAPGSQAEARARAPGSGLLERRRVDSLRRMVAELREAGHELTPGYAKLRKAELVAKIRAVRARPPAFSSKKTVAQLREMARARGVPRAYALRREELVRLLRR